MRAYSSRVVAFEPQPYYADFVRKALPRIEVMEFAVSDVEADTILNVPIEVNDAGMAHLDSQSRPSALPTRQIKVHSVTIDNLKLSRIGFVKIDVEGHEYAVLQGAKETIAQQKPNLLIEAEERHRPGAVASVSKFLLAHGYSGWFLSRGTLHPVADFDALRHQDPEALAARSQNANLGKSCYVNNFVFVQQRSMAALRSLVQRL
jgi:FkbM family methyltransferase